MHGCCERINANVKIGRVKSNTTCGYFIAKEHYSRCVSYEQLHVSAFFQAIIRLIIYPIRSNYTICSIKSLVSNEILFSSIKFHVRLNINYSEI